MPYTNTEGREQLLEGLAAAIDQLAVALAALGAAYEQLDDQTAERLEEGMFGPVQRAYARAKRTQSEFAARHGIEPRAAEDPLQLSPQTPARELIVRGAQAANEADLALTTVQDERAMIEVGDVELRSGVAAVREAISVVPQRVRLLLRTLGR